MGDKDSECSDAFRTSFKFYKRKQPPPDLSDVIDFNNQPCLSTNVIKVLNPHLLHTDSYDLQSLGVKHPSTWEIFQVTSHPGLIFIKNPFQQAGIEYWITQAFERYWHYPNPTNVKENINPECGDDFFLQKLRWATLGYHHNWDTKEYSEDYKGVFPEDLSKLSKLIATVIGHHDFEPEAAIVNYYAPDSSIGGHTDHSEKNHEAPLLSVSFGQTAIFLLGGVTKSTPPIPMYIRNGDIVIMSETVRLSYHAVPKILRNPDFKLSGRWSSVMEKMRVNINVRQVNV